MEPTELNVGDKLLIELDEDNVLTDEWVEVTVERISICHNPTKHDDQLDPYIGVAVDHPKVQFFNYSLYCQEGRVKRG